ncbi:MAG TPA: DUF1553 domain-containing protein [Verrucomicrobiae bacterium]|nr:DUF1553 domain-containing protein [Verrucomicrobiae bacterium]
MAEGWSLKKLHRLIMLSNAYQQSSADNPSFRNIDPENRLQWRMNRQRIDFESFRDAVLTVSGGLDLSIGGPPVPLFAQPSMRRRTVYGLIDRAQLPVALRAFDFANPEQHTPQRYLTTVPQHALFMMNDPFMAEQARLLAARPEVANEQSPSKHIQRIYRLALGRAATADELSLGQRFIEEQTQSLAPHQSSTETGRWQFGFGSYNETSSRLESFQPFRVFVSANQQLALLAATFPVFTEVWQVGNRLPDPTAGFANLTASGGEPGGPGYAVVRRWTGLADGVAHITGTVGHAVARELSDGIRARVILSRNGQLGLWLVAKTTAEIDLKDVQVKVGDTIDFVVDCGAVAFGDEFTWAPTVKLACKDKNGDAAEIVSVSAKEFRGSPAPTLQPWEQFALVILQSNEFVFID